jgi:hypothetical protein
MGDLPTEERNVRLSKVKEIMDAKSLDAALIYYDEFNIANGWYLTGWGSTIFTICAPSAGPFSASNSTLSRSW